MKRCIECNKEFNGILAKWCSMDCKETTFINNFEDSQWTNKLIATKVNLVLKKVEANLVTPFEGTLQSGKELERPKIADMLRTSFNKIGREEGS